MGLILPATEVLQHIEPVDPDRIQHVGNGVYELLWFPPILEMDIEVLRRTPGVTIVEEFEPANLPGWTGVRFTLDREVFDAAA
jgi:hypothetical protein